MTLSYDEAMQAGADRYADVLAALRTQGLPATFTQTGGMCAAIEVQLETGRTLLVTDANEPLAWRRVEHQGWGVGLYSADQDAEPEALIFAQCQDGSIEALVALATSVLRRSATST